MKILQKTFVTKKNNLPGRLIKVHTTRTSIHIRTEKTYKFTQQNYYYYY